MSTLAVDDELSRLLDFLTGQHRLVGERIRRSSADLPHWFLPNCTVIGIVSDEFLDAANYDRRPSPQGWRSDRPEVFWKPLGCWDKILVRKCVEFWTVERERCHEETLFSSGQTICARTCEAAMRIAEFCYPLPDGLSLGLRWIETKPPSFM
jgi:hypothetical protein